MSPPGTQVSEHVAGGAAHEGTLRGVGASWGWWRPGGGLCGPWRATDSERPPLLGKSRWGRRPSSLRVGAVWDPAPQCQLRSPVAGRRRQRVSAPLGAGTGHEGHPQGWHPSAPVPPCCGLDPGAGLSQEARPQTSCWGPSFRGPPAPRFLEAPPESSIWAVLFSVVRCVRAPQWRPGRLRTRAALPQEDGETT